MKRLILLSLGFLFLGLGILGMFLPVLPTTPFLLLASAMFLRSSEKWSNWLLNHKTFGKPIRNYTEHKAVSKKSKIFAMVFLWPTILISVSMVEMLWLKVLLIAIAIGVTIHLMSLKTMPEE